MNPDQILISLAALAIALAGFAAIFRAFHSGKEVDGHSYTRLNGIVEIGIAITVLSYLPVIFQHFEISTLIIYNFLSLIGGLYAFRWVIGLYAIRANATRTPKTYMLACILIISEILLFMMSAINLSNNTVGFYLLAILFLFVSQCLAFIGQFFAESGENPKQETS